MLNALLNDKKFRNELKFAIENSSDQFFIQYLRSKLPNIKLAHDRRFINNIYFDTPKYCLFHQAKEGGSPRTKIRIRWYGSHFCENEGAYLELKIKIGHESTKISHYLENFSFLQGDNKNNIKNYLKSTNLPDEISCLINPLFPSLVNRYTRDYFASADGNLRVTSDKKLLFFRCRHYQKLHYPKYINPHLSIIELKFQRHSELYKDIMSKLNFGLIRTQFSKYTFGLDNLRA